MIDNGLGFMGFDVYVNYFVIGGVLLFVVFVDVIL